MYQEIRSRSTSRKRSETSKNGTIVWIHILHCGMWKFLWLFLFFLFCKSEQHVCNNYILMYQMVYTHSHAPREEEKKNLWIRMVMFKMGCIISCTFVSSLLLYLVIQLFWYMLFKSLFFFALPCKHTYDILWTIWWGRKIRL